MFDWTGWTARFLETPENDADYTVKIQRTDAEGLVGRCIGVHLLDPEENTFDHHVLLVLVDQDGTVLQGARADWGWYGMAKDEAPDPVLLEKLPPEPPGNLPLWKTFQSVFVSILDAPGVDLAGSDVVYDLTTWFVYGEPADAGNLYHRSFLVVWQVQESDDEDTPVEDEPIVVPEEPTDVDVSQILSDASNLYMGLEELRHELLVNVIEPLEAINGTE